MAKVHVLIRDEKDDDALTGGDAIVGIFSCPLKAEKTRDKLLDELSDQSLRIEEFEINPSDEPTSFNLISGLVSQETELFTAKTEWENIRTHAWKGISKEIDLLRSALIALKQCKSKNDFVRTGQENKVKDRVEKVIKGLVKEVEYLSTLQLGG